MHDSEYWLKKRMEAIPVPRDIGEANMTEERIEQGRKTLLELIAKSKITEQNKKG